MSLLDDFVEHSAGPSQPGASFADGPYRRSAPISDRVGSAGIADVEHEGFEEDEGEEEGEDVGMVRALETGFIPSTRAASHQLPPLFALSLVQYPPPSAILSLTAANNLLFLASYPLSIIIIDLNKPDELVTIELPRPAAEKGGSKSQALKDTPVIQKLYADPTARHLIITTCSGDTFYLPVSPGNAALQSRRPRPLRLRQVITAVAWSPLSGQSVGDNANGDVTAGKGDSITPPSTDVLLGTSLGQVLSLPLPPQDDIFKSVSISITKPVERDLQNVYSLPVSQPVRGIDFGFWATAQTDGKTSKDGEKRAWVIITTGHRVYELQGPVTTTVAGGKGGGWAEEAFKPFREGAPKIQELPGESPSPESRIFLPITDPQSPNTLTPPAAFAWLAASGLYHSPVSAVPSSDILYKCGLFPYPSEVPATTPAFNRGPAPTAPIPPAIPVSLAITAWHWLLLYPDRIVGVARENQKVVWDEPLPLGHEEKAIGLSADPISRTLWVYTDKSILEVVVRNEDRDVWRAKLEKGEFAEALRFTRTPPQRDIVLSRQGDDFFAQGRFMQAAQCYAQSSRSFEYVALRFIDVDERDALRMYLSERLDLLDKRERTQRMMLATWLVEMYLSKCNTLEDIVAAESVTSDVESLGIERQMMEEDMRNFMTTYQHDLDPGVIYELILSHGRTDLYLFFANLNKDHGKVAEHWVTEEQWLKAIDTLNRQDSVELYYRFASALMRHAPKETVDSWLRQPALSPRRLIPALLQQQSSSQNLRAEIHAIRYLHYAIFQQHSTDTTIHNLLLTLHAAGSGADDGPLLRFLQSCPEDPVTEKPYYDLDYALRLCKQYERIQPCIHIYSKMGLYESSVDLALEKGDMELAKVNADRPEDDDILRKKLWLKIAKYVVQERKDIKSAMEFLGATDLIKIEDILPFFPDFVVIDDFKTEICTALEEYAARIEELKAEMDEATASAESIKRDIEGLANRFITVDPSDKCWKCGIQLISRQFYVFPCQHVFHADCLINMAMEFLPAPALRRILHLQNELVSSTSSEPAVRSLLSTNFPQPSSGSQTPRHSKDPSGRSGVTSGNTATDLLLGMTGRNKLLAAGDRLRELIIPDALAQAVSVVGVGGGSKKKPSRKERDQADERAEAARKEFDDLVAGVCPLCEGSIAGLDKPFILEGEDISDWDV